MERVERFFAALGADICHGGNRACYAVDPDQIRIPPFAMFRDAVSYYAVLGHECVHWTRHPRASTAILAASGMAMKAMRGRS